MNQSLPTNTTQNELVTIDNGLPLKEIAKIAATRDQQVCKETVWRWCRHGLNGVRLNYIKRGRLMLSSKAALNHFMRELAEKDAYEWPEFERKSPATKVRASAQHEDAKRILEEHGVRHRVNKKTGSRVCHRNPASE